MKPRILVSLVAALFAIGFVGLPVSYAAEFQWGDTTALKTHLEKHVKFPATGYVIKESFRQGENILLKQREYVTSTLKDDTTYQNPGEVLAALKLK